MKKIFQFLGCAILIALHSGCSLLNICGDKDAVDFYLAQWPENKAGALSLVIRDWNVSSNECYEVNFKMLQANNVRATFCVNSRLLDVFSKYSDENIFWRRLREYKNAGHELALDLYSYPEAGKSIIQWVKKYEDILYKRCGYKIRSVYFNGKNLSDIRPWVYELTDAGYLINEFGFYCHAYIPPLHGLKDTQCPEPASLVKYASSNRQWTQIVMPSSYFIIHGNLDSAEKFNRELFSAIKNSDIYTAPFCELEEFRRSRCNRSVEFLRSSGNRFELRVKNPGQTETDLVFAPSDGAKVAFEKNIKKTAENVYAVPANTVIRGYYKSNSKVGKLRGIRVCEYPGNRKSAYTLTADGSMPAHLGVWYPMLRKYNLPATFNLNMLALEKNAKLAADFAKIQSDKYELGNNTYACWPKEGRLANFTEDGFRADFNKAEALRAEYEFSAPVFSFPGSYHTDMARKVVAEKYPWMILNERNVTRAEKNFDAASFVKYLTDTNANMVEMLHTPDHGNKPVAETFERIFRELAKRKDDVSVTAYSRMRAYQYERQSSQIRYLESDKFHLLFCVKADVRTPVVPLTVEMQVLDKEKIDRLTVNGQDIPFECKNNRIYFDVVPNEVVKLSVKR